MYALRDNISWLSVDAATRKEIITTRKFNEALKFSSFDEAHEFIKTNHLYLFCVVKSRERD